MCELLGMSARQSTDVNHSLALLRPRGGEIGPHADGWGVAFYEGRAARVFKEPVPAADSRCLAFIADYDFQSDIVIGHIRKANPPRFGRASANTHPFTRELGGRSWVFAHNGKLPGLEMDPRFVSPRFRPTGDTDSEHAFCFLMDHVSRAWQGGDPLTATQLLEVLGGPIDALSALGELNILLSDGSQLLVFANEKLHQARRTCVERGCEQQLTMFATTPLTDEDWSSVADGRMRVYAGGRKVA